jgi:hypothetical protein
MVHQQWDLSPKAIVYVQPYVDRLERTCPEMMAAQVSRLVALAKAHLPPIKTWEAKLLVKCLCGFDMPDAETVPPDKIAKMIADLIRETFPIEFGAEWLTKEIEEFGQDPDWQAKFQMMPENVFAARLESALDSLRAYLLIVMVELYWEEEIATTAPGEEVGKAILSDYFNIEDPAHGGDDPN